MTELEKLIHALEMPDHVMDVLSGNTPQWILERALKSHKVLRLSARLSQELQHLETIDQSLHRMLEEPSTDSNIQFVKFISLVAAITRLQSPAAVSSIQKLRTNFPLGSTPVIPEVLVHALEILRSRVELTEEIHPIARMTAGVQTFAPYEIEAVGTSQAEPTAVNDSNVITVNFAARRRG